MAEHVAHTEHGCVQQFS